MLKKKLSIKVDYLSMVFETLEVEELIRHILGLPFELFRKQGARIKHQDYTCLYQFGTIKVYGDKISQGNTHSSGCYLVPSGSRCDDYYSYLQTTSHSYGYFFAQCNRKAGKGNFHLTRLDIAIDDKNEVPYFTIGQIKNKCLKEEFVYFFWQFREFLLFSFLLALKLKKKKS